MSIIAPEIEGSITSPSFLLRHAFSLVPDLYVSCLHFDLHFDADRKRRGIEIGELCCAKIPSYFEA